MISKAIVKSPNMIVFIIRSPPYLWKNPSINLSKRDKAKTLKTISITVNRKPILRTGETKPR